MKKQYGLGTLFLLLVGMAMLGNYFTAEPEAPLTAAQLREKTIQKHFSAWDGSHYELTKTIKESMNDPGSYEHEKTVYVDKGYYLIVETSFRGKNAFGGVVKNKVRAKVGSLTGTVIEVLGTD